MVGQRAYFFAIQLSFNILHYMKIWFNNNKSLKSLHSGKCLDLKDKVSTLCRIIWINRSFGLWCSLTRQYLVPQILLPLIKSRRTVWSSKAPGHRLVFALDSANVQLSESNKVRNNYKAFLSVNISIGNWRMATCVRCQPWNLVPGI